MNRRFLFGVIFGLIPTFAASVLVSESSGENTRGQISVHASVKPNVLQPDKVLPIGALTELQIRGGLPGFHAKAEAGGPMRVAFLGGSITAAKGWRVKTREFLQQRYPKAQVEEIFAAIPGTGSPLGVARLQRDVLAHHPDLLFVEFAVNDRAHESAWIERAMEGIVRKLRQACPGADICFVYTLSKDMVTDYAAGRLNSSAAAMERVAAHYRVPSIAFGAGVVNQLATRQWVFQADAKLGARDEAGRWVFSHDGVHPNDAGHALYFDAIARAWPELAGVDARAVRPAASLHADNWERAGFVSTGAAARTGAWRELPADDVRIASQPGGIAPPTWLSDTPGSTVEVIVPGTMIGLYGFKSEHSGRVKVTVDGFPPIETTLRDTFAVAGHYRLKAWFYPARLSPGPHRVRVELLAPEEIGPKQELFLSGIIYSGETEKGPDETE